MCGGSTLGSPRRDCPRVLAGIERRPLGTRSVYSSSGAAAIYRSLVAAAPLAASPILGSRDRQHLRVPARPARAAKAPRAVRQRAGPRVECRGLCGAAQLPSPPTYSCAWSRKAGAAAHPPKLAAGRHSAGALDPWCDARPLQALGQAAPCRPQRRGWRLAAGAVALPLTQSRLFRQRNAASSSSSCWSSGSGSR